MGGKCPHRSVKKRRYSHKTHRRAKFLVKDILFFFHLIAFILLMHINFNSHCEDKPLPIDEDLPGMGQYYCLHCDRYFANVAVRDEHFKTKKHRKRHVNGALVRMDQQLQACYLIGSSYSDCTSQVAITSAYGGVKIMNGPAPHTQLDADLAAGMGMPDNGPKLMSI
ncbi:hypothetical protein M9H77_24583 [Catharanthus roseus]|uniref:Uncharacterized protein n=1 Tax=Catharanthus roseus TaxID=4058 RepID=A0ACC0AWL4_CATRO|nr:hypothetical protein M9H77_24583 [Catharanthus roseus]